MTTSPIRRHVLRAAGLVGVSALAPGVVATHDTDASPPDHHSTATPPTRTCTRSCGETPEPCPDCSEDWSDGAITVYNCSPCQRKISISVTGEIGPERCVGECSDGRERAPSCSIQLASHERQTWWFTGSVRRLDAEAGDVNIAIAQRSEHEAHHCP